MRLLHIYSRNLGEFVRETKTHTVIKLKDGREYFAPKEEFVDYEQYCVGNEVNAFISYKNTFEPLDKKEVLNSIWKDYRSEPQIRIAIMNRLETEKYF